MDHKTLEQRAYTIDTVILYAVRICTLKRHGRFYCDHFNLRGDGSSTTAAFDSKLLLDGDPSRSNTTEEADKVN